MEGCEGGNKKFKDDGKVREGRSFSSLLISLPIVDVLVIRSIKYIYIYITSSKETTATPRSDFYSRSNRESGDPGKIRATNPSPPPLSL